MPQVYSDIPRPEIITLLRKNGYGIDSCRGYAFRICVRSKTHVRKSTGLGEFVPVGGPTEEQMQQIEHSAADVQDAARMVVAISTGKAQQVADLTGAPGAAGPSTQSILVAVDNRINAALDPIKDQLAAIAKMLLPPKPEPVLPPIEEPEITMLPPLVDTPMIEHDLPAKKKGGWPKGKPRKPKVGS
jgi:hypothetical protein